MSRIYTVGISPASYFASELTLWQDAVASLNTLQSNFAVVDAIRKTGRGMNKHAIPEMVDWCRKIGYKVCASPSDNHSTTFVDSDGFTHSHPIWTD